MQTNQEKKGQRSIQKRSMPQYQMLKVERQFDISVDQLFGAFKSERSLKMWWWPMGLFADSVDLDLRVGGRYYINMKGLNQMGGGMTGEFTEVIENERIVMTDHFADQNGRVVSAQAVNMPGVWPDVVYITFEFEKVDLTRSRLRLLQTGIPDEVQKDCVQGWNESFDKLENVLGLSKH